MPPRRFRRLRMNWPSHTKRRRAEDAAPPERSTEIGPAQAPDGEEPTWAPGAEQLRRRGAVLRRLLAFADWAALIAALFVVTAVSSSTEVGTLFWAMLFSPTWVIVLKFHGLYDNDHRRIRHSTLDELPTLISAGVLGTLVLGAFLASFVLRGVLRFLWHRLTGQAAGLVIGPPKTVDMVARRVSTHPETRLELVGYLSAQPEATATELPRLGSLADISRVA